MNGPVRPGSDCQDKFAARLRIPLRHRSVPSGWARCWRPAVRVRGGCPRGRRHWSSSSSSDQAVNCAITRRGGRAQPAPTPPGFGTRQRQRDLELGLTVDLIALSRHEHPADRLDITAAVGGQFPTSAVVSITRRPPDIMTPARPDPAGSRRSKRSIWTLITALARTSPVVVSTHSSPTGAGFYTTDPTAPSTVTPVAARRVRRDDRFMTEASFDPHALLAESRLGVLATLKANGIPQLSPVQPFYDLTVGTLSVSMTEGRAKTANLRRDPRAALEVTSADGRCWATAEGAVTLTGPGTDPYGPEVEALVRYYRTAAGEHPDWDEYRATMVADRRVLMTMTVMRVYGDRI